VLDENSFEVFSLHATKPFAIGEGGAIRFRLRWAKALRLALNFGGSNMGFHKKVGFRFYFHLLTPLSDGFAITQLEAQAYGLPIISSTFCGRVVESGRNGFILEEPNAASIANAVRDCIANTTRLQQFAAASRLPDEFTIDALGQRLQELGSAL
jgi:glycosyltransferase involved in cell wall biosynthesis